MIRYVCRSWWRNKNRFLLLLVGVFILSGILPYLVGVSTSNKGTVTHELEKRWRTPYHIVVRPPGSGSSTEKSHLLEPNYLSSLSGGISLEQYEKIKKIPDIEVAAPIAMMGYGDFYVPFDQLKPDKNGIYRVTMKTTTENGVQSNTYTDVHYGTMGGWNEPFLTSDGDEQEYLMTLKEYGTSSFPDNIIELAGQEDILIAGIDPEQEAKLVGIDQAIVPMKNSRYFTEDDQRTPFPVLINNDPFSQKEYQFSIEKIDLPFSTPKTATATMNTVKEKGGEQYLNSLKGTEVYHKKFNLADKQEDLFKQLIVDKRVQNTSVPYMTGLAYKSSPITYKKAGSPFPEKWNTAFEVVPQKNNLDFLIHPYTFQNEKKAKEEKFLYSYRPLIPNSQKNAMQQMYTPTFIGIFDSAKLKLSTDPLNQLPFETYQTPFAKLVMDATGQPINPPKPVTSNGTLTDVLTRPPSMITTLTAAAKILGDKPISSIRIKVKDIGSIGEKSQKKIEMVAKEIEDETGLKTDITLGSSPQPTLIKVPGLDGGKDWGWLEQPWINIGSSILIFRETQLSFSVFLWSVILVAVIYVFATNYVSLLNRRKEFALLLAVGWGPRKLSQLIFAESFLLAGLVAVLSCVSRWIFALHDGGSLPVLDILGIGLFSFLIYLAGALIPALMAGKLEPHKALQSGEVTQRAIRLFRSQHTLGLSLNHFFGKIKRNLFSVVSMAVPSALLGVLLFITFHLKGVLYTSWLGQFIATKIGATHYITMILALIIAVVTATEIIWQNISDRNEEISLYKAIGWKNRNVMRVVLMEGLLTGIFAGLFSVVLSMLSTWLLFQELRTDFFIYLLAVGAIPVVMGIVAAVVPALYAVSVSPIGGLARRSA